MLKVPARFKCVVRVVAAMPCQAEYLRSSDGTYRMRLTLEDSTARIHAFVIAEDGVRTSFHLSVTLYYPMAFSIYVVGNYSH